MGTYTGTGSADVITTTQVSTGVIASPPGSRPSAAADTIDGGGGNDTIDGGGGANMINGGPGLDAIADAGDGSIIHGDGGADSITESGKGNTVYGDAGGDVIRFSDNGNTAYGGDGDDTLSILYDDNPGIPSGVSYLHGGAGNDFIDASEDLFNVLGDLTLYAYGDAGDDTLNATNFSFGLQGSVGYGTDFLYGGPGDDTYYVFEATDAAIENGGEGQDTVRAFMTDYTLGPNVENLELLDFGDGPHFGWILTGNNRDNTIFISDTHEVGGFVINGVGGADTLTGSVGGDTIDGGPGNDTLYGKPSGVVSDDGEDFDTDVIHGRAGDDLIYGGGGRFDWWDSDDVLYGDAGNDTIYAQYGNDTVRGGIGDDALYGDAGDDVLYGNAGHDVLEGGNAGRYLGGVAQGAFDRLYGQVGDDILRGDDGADRLDGGPGEDIYDYNDPFDSRPGTDNRDVILSFDGVGATLGDRIDLSTLDADWSTVTNDAFVFVGTAPLSAAGQVGVKSSGANTLIQAQMDDDAGIDLEILVQDGGVAPSAYVGDDFIL